MGVVLAIDAGTTGVRTVAVDEAGAWGAYAYRELPQHFPRPGWVEHDPDDIWNAVSDTLAEVVTALDGATVAAIGITNQRETIVAWDRASGRPLGRAIVWQDRRTAARCDELRAAGLEPLVRARTGLVLDPYFSATKLEWLLRDGRLHERGAPRGSDLAFGTVDSWILWNLTGVHATDPSNASRTMLFDIDALAWCDELLDVFAIPRACLPAVVPTSGRIGLTDPARAAGLRVPVSAMVGDQQASLFGQGCVAPGMTKNTYGTGSFVLVNLGASHPGATDGLLTTVAWQIGDAVTYAMEGSIFVTGAAVQWLRDGLGFFEHAADAATLAATVPDTGGVAFVPAFSGLGSPYWDPYARGTIVGLTRGTTRAHLTRAAIEAMAWQTADVIDAVAAVVDVPVTELSVDGGASRMDLLCQFQADVLGVPVRRPAVVEATVLGAAFLAGIAEDVWPAPAPATSVGTAAETSAGMPSMLADAVTFRPQPVADLATRRSEWCRAVERARGWADPLTSG
jgi:glycerol kinase